HAVKPSWITFPPLGSVIGVGGCGTVHRGEMRRNRRDRPIVVAIKKLRPVGGRDKRLRMAIALIRELVVWSNLRHTNILPFVGYYLDPRLESAWLVAPYMRNSNLSDYLRRERLDQDACVRLDVLPLLEALRIKKSDLSYDATTPLGSGRFGTVFRATQRNLPGAIVEEVVAVKELFHVFDETARTRLEDNVRSWAALKHPNVFSFRGFCEEDDKVFLVFPYHPGGTLAAYLEKDSLTYARRMDLATETAQGLLYLHTRDPPICHGNLHLNNIFMYAEGRPLISDYGISTVVDKMNVAALTQTDESSRYRSPEILTDGSPPTTRSDIITGKRPYEFVIDAASLAERIRLEHALPAAVDTLDCPPRAQNIMGYCWKHDPELRPPIGDVVAILTGQACRFERVTDITITQNEIHALEFSRDGRYLAVVLNEGVQIISTDTWKPAVDLAFPRKCTSRRGYKFSPSNRFFALGLGNEDFAVWIWDLRSGKLHKTLLGMTGIVWGIDISADDNFVVTCPGEGDCRLWQLHDDEEGRILHTKGSSGGVAVAISPKCDLVVAESSGGDLSVWEQRQGTLLAALHGGGGLILGELRRWEVEMIRKDKSEASHTAYHFKGGSEISALSVSPDNSWFAAISANHGDVHVLQSSISDSTRASNIGKVPACGLWRCVSLGPISNNASGLAIGTGGGAEGAGIVYKYASWDFPGAYLV
ncbi:Nuclear receptor sub 2 group C member 2, partial [Tulasnella sp. 403]